MDLGHGQVGLGGIVNPALALEDFAALLGRHRVAGVERGGALVKLQGAIEAISLEQGETHAGQGQRVFGELFEGGLVGGNSAVPLLVPRGRMAQAHSPVENFASSNHALGEYIISSHFFHVRTSTPSGISSRKAFSIAERMMPETLGTSAVGHSTTSSSCTCSSILAVSPASRNACGSRSMASLMMSAAVAWMGALMASRSARALAMAPSRVPAPADSPGK